MFQIFSRLFKFSLPAIFFFLFIPSKLMRAQFPVTYPLHVGDYWQYTTTITREITKDTVMSNGFAYAKKVSSGFGNTIFQRFENDSVFQYYNDQDVLFYDFSRSPGDTVSTIIDGSDTLDITLVENDTVNIFGKERRQWQFYLDVRHIFDEEEYHWITDSLGLTKWMNILFSYRLLGAVIDGETIGVITAVDANSDPIVKEFKLFQNYPNPFNASTQIRFTIPKSAFVSLKIYSVLGEEIAALISERLNAGTHTYDWDTVKLSSGIYYYHFIADNFREVKKMILIK